MAQQWKLDIKETVHCLQSRLSLFVYIRNNVCIIYINGNSNTELFQAVNSHVKFCLEFYTDSRLSIDLPVIDAFVISV